MFGFQLKGKTFDFREAISDFISNHHGLMIMMRMCIYIFFPGYIIGAAIGICIMFVMSKIEYVINVKYIKSIVSDAKNVENVLLPNLEASKNKFIAILKDNKGVRYVASMPAEYLGLQSKYLKDNIALTSAINKIKAGLKSDTEVNKIIESNNEVVDVSSKIWGVKTGVKSPTANINNIKEFIVHVEELQKQYRDEVETALKETITN